MKDKSGGPAFPQSIAVGADGQLYVSGGSSQGVNGMSLRDYFAAAAMQAIIAHPHGNAGKWQVASEDAYKAADAMLAEREKD